MDLHHDTLDAAFPGERARFFLLTRIGGAPELADDGAALILAGIKTTAATWGSTSLCPC